MNCISRVQQYIECHKLLLPGEQVLVALSGGADSVALLLLLQRLGYKCLAVHCNFHLRGEESMRDETFVRELCVARNITLHIEHFETIEYAQQQKVSIEMAARQLRYDLFFQLLEIHRLRLVAVAHHQNDQAETALMNMVRGTGIHGIRGMLPRNGKVIRPLLCLSRQEVQDYLKTENQPYITDSTNLQTDYKRNKVRLQVIPLLQELNSAAIANIARSCEHLAVVEELYNRVISDELKTIISQQSFELGKSAICLDREKLTHSNHHRCLLHEVLFAYGFNQSQEESLLTLDSDASGRVFKSTDWNLLVNRNQYIIESSIQTIIEEERLPLTGRIQTKAGFDFELRVMEREVNGEIEKQKTIACLDADTIREHLVLRPVRKGDWFIPFGMKGKKLLSDFMTNLKFSKWEKERQCVLCMGNSIVWVVGIRIDQRFAITPDTKRILRIELL